MQIIALTNQKGGVGNMQFGRKELGSGFTT